MYGDYEGFVLYNENWDLQVKHRKSHAAMEILCVPQLRSYQPSTKYTRVYFKNLNTNSGFLNQVSTLLLGPGLCKE